MNPAYPVITDRAKPAWHFGPPAHWMNDPNGACWHDGWWHVFYQHNPASEEWANMHWGHARSRDLVHWEHLPLVLYPQHAASEKHCCSGCLAFAADGQPSILYTSSKTDPDAALTQVLATPNDSEWRTWTQHVYAPFLALPTHGGPAFGASWRDPFVFRAAGRTFLILGADLGDEAVVPLYENPTGDLKQWQYRGILHRAPKRETMFFECPCFLPFGDKWVLITSPVREVEWWSGTFDPDRAEFHAERWGRVDESDHYYASHTAYSPDGSPVMFGWAQKFPKGRGWNGRLGVPRRIWLDDAGELRSEPVAALASLREAETVLAAQPLPLALPLPEGGLHEGELTLEIERGAGVRLELCGEQIDLAADTVRFGERPAVELPTPGTVQLRWLLDRSLLEVFVDARAAFTRVVPFPPAATIRLTMSAGSARLAAGRVWTLRAAPATVG